MKKRIRLLCFLPFLWACTSEEAEDISTDGIVSFANCMETKAIESDLNKPGKSFGVFASKTYDETDFYPVFNNQEVVYQEKGWSYSPVRYWDKEAAYVFKAFYPYRKSGISGDMHGNLTIETINVLERDANNNQIDWLIASKSFPKGTNSPILFSFQHLLANVNITIRKKDWENDVILNNFHFTGMKIVGSFNEANNPEWSVSGSDYNGNLFNVNNPVVLTDETTATPLFSDILMIPQSISSTMKFILNYTYEGISYRKEIILNQKGYTTPWKQGTIIKYGLIITPESIQFEPIIITPWGEGEGENIPILPQ
ncbi:MAG: fimbrillin family protein [Bacteroidales bacterium]